MSITELKAKYFPDNRLVYCENTCKNILFLTTGFRTFTLLK